MSEHLREIEQLRRELEQERREKEQAKAREEQERREKEQAKAREEQAEKRAEAAEREVQKTTLEEYLRDCHLHIFKALRIADKSVSSTGHATRVDGKRYPMWLRRWDDFANIQQDSFHTINMVFGDRRLFPQSIATLDKKADACPDPVATEKDIDTFEKVAIESPVRRILQKALEIELYIRQKFNFTGLRFSNNSRDIRQQEDLDQAEGGSSGEMQERRRRSGPSKRIASEQKVKPPRTYPDGLGIRTRLEGDENLAFVYDYKAAHKLAVEDLKPALANEKLFMEVIHRANDNKTRTDPVLKGRDKADEQVAMALTQVFDYMVQRGVAYGYATAGKSLIFLHIKQDDLRTLYYHPCVPDEEADDKNGGVNVSHTAVAELASFCLVALRSEALQGSVLEDLQRTAKAELKSWAEPYDEAEEHLEAEDMESSQSAPSSQATVASRYSDKSNARPIAREFSLRSKSTCKDTATIRRDDEDEDDPSRTTTRMRGTASANKRKEGPSSGSSGDDGHEMSSDSDSPPTRQYCTQACLLGLKRGWDLDEHCPNFSSHRTIQGGTRHPISATELASLVGRQLRRNPYRLCVAVDPFGLHGKIGAIGALFKLELARYGYTLVAKGTQSAHLRCLQHESFIYSKLENLQGEAVPVHLGIVDLAKPWGYILGMTRVLHLMLMSWGGEVAADAGLPDLAAEQRRSSLAVWREGVDHGDERLPNMLWSSERQRVMLVDFDRAVLRNPSDGRA